jgi:1-deoxy-D-xylulose-5-phosphate synthase
LCYQRIKRLQKVKGNKKFLHIIITTKGKGLKQAEEDQVSVMHLENLMPNLEKFTFKSEENLQNTKLLA